MRLLRFIFPLLTIALLPGCANHSASSPIAYSCQRDDGLSFMARGDTNAAREWWSKHESKSFPHAKVAVDVLAEWGLAIRAESTSSNNSMIKYYARDRASVFGDWRECAEDGNLGAQVLLSITHLVTRKNLVLPGKARAFYSRLAKRGYSVGLLGLAVMAQSRGNKYKERELIGQLISESDIISKFMVGRLYMNDVILSVDYKEAAYWFKQSAEEGDVRSQGVLGYMYLSGLGVEKDQDRANFWLERQRTNPDFEYDKGYKIIEDYWIRDPFDNKQ